MEGEEPFTIAILFGSAVLRTPPYDRRYSLPLTHSPTHTSFSFNSFSLLLRKTSSSVTYALLWRKVASYILTFNYFLISKHTPSVHEIIFLLLSLSTQKVAFLKNSN